MYFALMEKLTVTKYEIFVKSHENNKMGYITPDIIIIIITTQSVKLWKQWTCRWQGTGVTKDKP